MPGSRWVTSSRTFVSIIFSWVWESICDPLCDVIVVMSCIVFVVWIRVRINDPSSPRSSCSWTSDTVRISPSMTLVVSNESAGGCCFPISIEESSNASSYASTNSSTVSDRYSSCSSGSGKDIGSSGEWSDKPICTISSVPSVSWGLRSSPNSIFSMIWEALLPSVRSTVLSGVWNSLSGDTEALVSNMLTIEDTGFCSSSIGLPVLLNGVSIQWRPSSEGSMKEKQKWNILGDKSRVFPLS